MLDTYLDIVSEEIKSLLSVTFVNRRMENLKHLVNFSGLLNKFKLLGFL